MTITAICTKQANTTLSIMIREPLKLVQMDVDAPIQLEPGMNKVVVGPGVFKLASPCPISVLADNGDSVILTTNGKDSGWPDPGMLKVNSEQQSKLQQFFAAEVMMNAVVE